jgi:uncharacterized protein
VKIEVTVKPNSRKEGVEQLPTGTYKVSVNAPPKEGRANERVIELLARHFKIPKTSVVILRGHKGKRKLVEVAAPGTRGIPR